MILAYLFDPNMQIQDRNGRNNVNGFLRVYLYGTDDRATTYRNFDGTLNSADIRLDNNGRAVVIVDATKAYRLEVYDRHGILLWTQQPLSARGEGRSEYVQSDEVKSLVVTNGERSEVYYPLSPYDKTIHLRKLTVKNPDGTDAGYYDPLGPGDQSITIPDQQDIVRIEYEDLSTSAARQQLAEQVFDAYNEGKTVIIEKLAGDGVRRELTLKFADYDNGGNLELLVFESRFDTSSSPATAIELELEMGNDYATETTVNFPYPVIPADNVEVFKFTASSMTTSTWTELTTSVRAAITAGHVPVLVVNVGSSKLVELRMASDNGSTTTVFTGDFAASESMPTTYKCVLNGSYSYIESEPWTAGYFVDYVSPNFSKAEAAFNAGKVLCTEYGNKAYRCVEDLVGSRLRFVAVGFDPDGLNYDCLTLWSDSTWSVQGEAKIVTTDGLQSLDSTEQASARNNIGAASASDMTALQAQALALEGSVDDIEQLIPPSATTANKLATSDDLTAATASLNFVTPEMFGAVGDGVTDDTAAIQAAMNACSIVLFGDKTYIVDVSGGDWSTIGRSGLKCNSGQVLFLGNCTLKAKPNTNSSGFYDIISTNNANDIKILGGHIVGDNDAHVGATGEFGFGISIRNSVDVIIDGIHIEKCWGDGIFVNPHDSTSELPSSGNNIFISRCHIHHCRRQGISVTSGCNIRIDNCAIHDIRGTAPEYAIDIEPDGGKKVKCITISKLFAPEHYGVAVSGAVEDARIVDSFIITLITYTKVYVDSCKIRYISVTSSSSMLVASHVTLSTVACDNNSSAILDSCDFHFDATSNYGGCVFLSQLDLGPVKLHISNSSFEFKANGFTTYFIYSTVSGGGNISEIEFTNCSFEASDAPAFVNIPNANVTFKDCKINVNNGNPSINIRGGVSTTRRSLRFIGCQMNFGGQYLLGLGIAAGEINVIFERCLFNKVHSYLGYLDQGVNVNFKFKDNVFEIANSTQFPDLRYIIPAGSTATASLVVLDNSLFTSKYGATSDRPTGLRAYDAGYEYFDTTLGKPIVWNGTAWVNVDGTSL